MSGDADFEMLGHLALINPASNRHRLSSLAWERFVPRSSGNALTTARSEASSTIG
jgi:hypothetical protein